MFEFAKWKIELPSHRHVTIGERFKVTNYSITKNGKRVEVEPQVTVNKNGVLSIDDEGYVVAAQAGKGMITVSYEGATATQSVVVNNNSSKETLIISGDTKIKVSRTALYEVVSDTSVVFSLVKGADLALCEVKDNNRCEIKTNTKGQIGEIVLKAENEAGDTATKTIEIIPLWQVI